MTNEMRKLIETTRRLDEAPIEPKISKVTMYKLTDEYGNETVNGDSEEAVQIFGEYYADYKFEPSGSAEHRQNAWDEARKEGEKIARMRIGVGNEF